MKRFSDTGIFFISALLFSYTFFSGCSSLTQVRFDVDLSALDYVQMVRHSPQSDGQTYTVFLELQGSGYVEYRAGTGNKARSGFWKDTTEADLRDVARDRIVLDRETTRALLQVVVNAGAFDRDRTRTPDGAINPIFVQARIGSYKNIFLTSEPAFVKLFNQLLGQLGYSGTRHERTGK